MAKDIIVVLLVIALISGIAYSFADHTHVKTFDFLRWVENFPPAPELPDFSLIESQNGWEYGWNVLVSVFTFIADTLIFICDIVAHVTEIVIPPLRAGGNM